ncbi:MAG: oligopeptide ABC transporter permease OppC [Erysipelotrichaceae bacterium]|nr:oligopeptide ABC transporter permease OppC [Erysipelotrichaceae bacterium]
MDNMDNRFVFVEHSDADSEHIAAPTYSYWKSVFKRFFSSKVAIFMLVVSLFVILMAIFQPIISQYNHASMANVNNFETHNIRPNLTYLFGTDNSGRSLFDAVWAGTRTSLKISFTATLIVTVVGVIVGAFWGYSKKIDVFMIELYNIIANVPFTLIAMVMMYILGPGVWQLIFALSCTTWLSTAYFIRVQVMIIRDREYNLASRCLGTPVYKVILHNVLPFLISVIVTVVSRDVPSFISYEVFLSYLGIGLNKNVASLGALIQDYSQYMDSAGYLFWIPVAISALISISLYIVGQTLADASDPRTHMI